MGFTGRSRIRQLRPIGNNELSPPPSSPRDSNHMLSKDQYQNYHTYYFVSVVWHSSTDDAGTRTLPRYTHVHVQSSGTSTLLPVSPSRVTPSLVFCFIHDAACRLPRLTH
jgi:hypothetical protein